MDDVEHCSVTWTVRTGREALAKRTCSRLFATVRIAATADDKEPRARLRVALALDTSGSMEGTKLDEARRATRLVCELLEPEDSLSVVTFSGEARLVSQDLGGGKASGVAIRRLLEGLRAHGCTNLSDAIELAHATLGVCPPKTRQAILILTDGNANRGLTEVTQLASTAAGARSHASTSTLGFGVDHDERVLEAIATAGGGSYHFIPDPESAVTSLARALGSQGDAVADQVELYLLPREGVVIHRVLGIARQSVVAGGLRLSLPDLLAGRERLLGMDLEVTTGSEWGRMPLFEARLEMRQTATSKRATLEKAIAIDVASDQGPVDAEVHHEFLVLKAAEASLEAHGHAARGELAMASSCLEALLAQMREAEGFDEAGVSPLAEAYAQLADELALYKQRPSRQQIEFAGKMQSQAPLSDVTRRTTIVPGSREFSAVDFVAGDGHSGAANTVQIVGLSGVRDVVIPPVAVVGRTSSADIFIADPTVSRMHAKVARQDGAWVWIQISSVGGSTLDGQPLPLGSSVLPPGAVVVVGADKTQIRFARERP